MKINKKYLKLLIARDSLSVIELLKFQIYNFITYRNTVVFGNIGIETQSSCNRQCKNCPVAYYPRKMVKMPESMFKSIIDQLAEKNYKGEISLHWYNEPLLDRRLPQLIHYAHCKCPESYIYFASNGDLLDMETFKAVIGAGLRRIEIAEYGEGLSYDLREFLNSLDEVEKKFLHIFKLNNFYNRAGALEELRIQKSLTLRCARPEFQMIVNAEGKVVLCCNDYFGKEIMGDVAKENIFDIWRKSRFKQIRAELRKGNRKNIDLCSQCDLGFDGYRLPKRRQQQ